MRPRAEIVATLCHVRMRSSIVCFTSDKSRCKLQDVASVSLFVLSLTQAWNFLNSPLCSTVALRPRFAYTLDQCGHARSHRWASSATAEPPCTHTHIYVYIYPERRTAMHVPQVLGLRAREKLVSVANFKPRGTAFLELNYAGEACGKIRKPTR